MPGGQDDQSDLVILGAGSGGYACALRAAELGLSRRSDREGQARRHLPAPRLHPDQGAAARRRDRRRRPRGASSSACNATFDGIDMAGRQHVQGRRRRPTVQGPAGPDQGPRHHRRRGRGPARRRRRPSQVGGDDATPARTSCWPPAPTRARCPGSTSTARGSSTSEHALRLDHVPASVDRARRRRHRLRVRQRLDVASAPRSPSSRRCRTSCRSRTRPAPSCSSGRSAAARSPSRLGARFEQRRGTPTTASR